jgi:tetratricopeptide (TPR) repeat protein
MAPPRGVPVMQGSSFPAPRPPVVYAPVGQAQAAAYGGAPPPSEAAAVGRYDPPTQRIASPALPGEVLMGQRRPLPAPGNTAVSTDPLVYAARQSYAEHRYEDAIRSYRALIAKGSDNPAVFGELGNVLLAAGRPQEAAQAYYEASSRFIDRGQPATVYLLLSYVESYDPLLGAILNRRLASLPRSLN